MDRKIPLLLLVGPTAVGKSSLAVELALRLDGEIVSADSRQLYRGFDIGTAKPTLAERRGIPHHLIDILPPQRWISVADYQALARAAIADVYARGKRPLLVGGTGFYVRAVVDGLLFPGVAAQPELRERLHREAKEAGSAILHDRLKRTDPQAAARIHPHDLFRLVRALEVITVTGRPLTELQRREEECPYELTPLALTAGRDALYCRIDRRVEAMMAAGLLEETAGLWQHHARGSPLLDTLGYRELVAHLRGETDLPVAIATIKLRTRQYAKRQLTWFRADQRLVWLDVSEYANMSAGVDRICALVDRRIDRGLIGPN